MKLIFRGNSYNAPANEALTVETNQTAQFRGNAYKVRAAQQPASRNNAELTYRGVNY